MATLPELHWGDPDSSRRALLLHGLNGAAGVWWDLGERLAASGWSVTAVDLRGHGDAPRTEDYAINGYVEDLPSGPWTAVVGHSLGGVIAVHAAQDADFAASVVLLDPPLTIPGPLIDQVRDEQLAELEESADSVRAQKAHWHPREVDAKLAAVASAERSTVLGTFRDNQPWAYLDLAETIPVPTLLIGGDPTVTTMLDAEEIAGLRTANPLVQSVTIAGTGHSPHRDRPEETFAGILEWLAGRHATADRSPA